MKRDITKSSTDAKSLLILVFTDEFDLQVSRDHSPRGSYRQYSKYWSKL